MSGNLSEIAAAICDFVKGFAIFCFVIWFLLVPSDLRVLKALPEVAQVKNC
jgi:hypothetical protein